MTGKAKTLRAAPCTLKQANALVEQLHRHHKPCRGHRFSIAAYKGDRLTGAVIVGRPVAPKTDPYAIAEVTRCVTDGTDHVCSFLYQRAARAAQAMGFAKIQTFVLESESGASLRGAGWTCEGPAGQSPNSKGWQSRGGRTMEQPTDPKVRYARVFVENAVAAGA